MQKKLSSDKETVIVNASHCDFSNDDRHSDET
jgi:hypothetical protein